MDQIYKTGCKETETRYPLYSCSFPNKLCYVSLVQKGPDYRKSLALHPLTEWNGQIYKNVQPPAAPIKEHLAEPFGKSSPKMFTL